MDPQLSPIEAIPHGPPMRAVRALVRHDEASSEVLLHIAPDHPLLIAGRCPAVAAVELLAQAAAVHAAARGGGHGGVLLRVRGFDLHVDELPVGRDLRAHVRRTDGTDGPTAAFAVELRDGEVVLAGGSLLVRAT